MTTTIDERQFLYLKEHDYEQASNGYLMSLIALMVGFPLPIVNLIATGIFYLGNRKRSFFVRWHCLQALFMQFSLFVINSIGFSWTMSIIFGNNHINNQYIAYLITIFIFNFIEFIFTMIAAIKTRKGVDVKLWFYSSLTHLVCKN